MTLDDANKIDEQAYDEMHREHVSEQSKLDAYFKGYEKGIDRTIRILRNHIINNEKDGDQK